MDDLIRAIQEGREDLIEELWMKIRDLIAYYAVRYIQAYDCSRYGVEKEDLIQCGYFAMLDALKTYDVNRTDSHFPYWLKYYLKKHFRSAMGIRTTRRDMLNSCASLDVEIDDDGTPLVDLVPDRSDQIGSLVDRIYNEELQEAIEEAFKILPQKMADTLRAEFWEGRSLTDYAKETGRPYSEVWYRHHEGLWRLRTRTELRKFLDGNTNFYAHKSAKRFNETGSSVVEDLVMSRDKKEREYADRLCSKK